ncbi:hypothetical protein [Dyadobacter frigoris]|uniref:Uncharacterized protein n=1 Tax=Dyadobacter frigoris TaxID=2576211 RepID=A0A4U6DCP6_9BACT|nr:hypothetical protein [Dyadobacter frigoris]TKT94048.1 hypothetical protein FDK13_02230 [Dyadobacter frigoris]
MQKNILLIFTFLLLSELSFGQQDFRFNYNFKRLINEPNIELYKYDKTQKKYSVRKTNLEHVRGALTKISIRKDTLSVKLWPNAITPNADTPNVLSSDDNYSDFIITIPDDDNYPVINRYKGFDLPFSSTQLFAINIPLRMNLKNSTVGSEFINANISLSKIYGRTRIYQSEFVKPRTSFWGWGGFLGLGGTKNSIDKEEVGINYGFNIIGSIYKINLLVAIGFESGLSKYGKTSPFLGFGFGFDLVSVSSLGFSEK